ncbi:MAG: pyridoxamine 5'-phosphate oxidase family protein [Gemmatimonadales bacterium]|nr:pyridoxamine 5'-phosphate oxidase family protein [Gemmatimonadales bacterium]MDZ4390254.1 pyridoxamine 5'-phosphate oxidase family protein [Gemmatimonadales bacterium]
MRIESPYHEGERLVQERACERGSADINGRVIGSAIPVPALGFIGQQQMAVMTSIDRDSRPWVSLSFGDPGFIAPKTTQQIDIDPVEASRHKDDPFWQNIAADDRVGLLLIELATRRRLRISGRVSIGPESLSLAVERAYPNCPKYIQRRHLTKRSKARIEPLAEPIHGKAITPEQQVMIEMADTLFVASLHPEHGADASHRGGRPGFVQVISPTTIRIPDYAGNSMFNTLGNFAVHPSGGILIPDFAGQRTLQLAGEVELRWDLDDPDQVTGGTGRFWDFNIVETIELPLPIEAAWEFLDASPFNP